MLFSLYMFYCGVSEALKEKRKTNLSKSQIPWDADGAVTLDHVVARDNDVAAMREMAQSVRLPR